MVIFHSCALAYQYRRESYVALMGQLQPACGGKEMSRRLRLLDVEVAIIRALANGLQSKEIATALDRSRPTIEFHIRMLYLKLDAKSRAQLVARAYDSGLLTSASSRRILAASSRRPEAV